MSITAAQAKRLQAEIQKLVEAEVADSWKGGGDPADIPAIEAELEAAKLRLALFIERLQLGGRQ